MPKRKKGKNKSEEDKKKAFNTFTVKTPNGGLHLYFKYREGLKSDSNNKLSIDLKTSGGLIVAPGSIRKMKDGTYKTYTVYKDVEIQEIPEGLFNELLKYFGKVTKEGYVATGDVFRVHVNDLGQVQTTSPSTNRIE